MSGGLQTDQTATRQVITSSTQEDGAHIRPRKKVLTFALYCRVACIVKRQAPARMLFPPLRTQSIHPFPFVASEPHTLGDEEGDEVTLRLMLAHIERCCK